MERLLASPKTTAVLPARLIMLSLFLHGRRGWRRTEQFLEYQPMRGVGFVVSDSQKNRVPMGLEFGQLMRADGTAF
jgi:hypothetical protein